MLAIWRSIRNYKSYNDILETGYQKYSSIFPARKDFTFSVYRNIPKQKKKNDKRLTIPIGIINVTINKYKTMVPLIGINKPSRLACV